MSLFAGGRRLQRRATFVTLLALIAAVPACHLPPDGTNAAVEGFTVTTELSGLNYPTNLELAPDGRVFVAEKSGRVVAFDGLDDTTPAVVVDLGGDIHNYEDRGLLGLEVDPGFPTDPYLYVLYTLDPGDSWGDACPSPPGTFDDGCVVNARLARLTVDADNHMVGDELVLLEDMWCAQFPSHTVGDLEFTPDGALLVSAGDGADYNSVDYGQRGGSAGSPTPANPCGDPPGGTGVALTAPTARGGALRSQTLTGPGTTHTYDGSILRVDPDTGAALPDNPLVGGDDPVDDRVIAHGFRNPYRMAARPGTGEVWLGDVGWGTWEEVNRIPDPADGVVENFGWPCYEGFERQSSYGAVGLDVCEDLYDGTTATALTDPYYAYRHGQVPDPGHCGGDEGDNGAAVTAVSFYDAPGGTGGGYPAAYDGALFFGDYARRCIWAMKPDASGTPDPTQVETAVVGAYVVDIEAGPGGDLFFVDILEGTISRLSWVGSDVPPRASIEATPDNGPLPLAVQLDGSESTSGVPGALTYAWDLDGDGEYDDSTAASPAHTYTTAADVTVGLRVTNAEGLSDTATTVVHAGNSRPQPVIAAPTSGTLWQAGQTLALEATATDPDGGTVAASTYEWQVDLHHCSTPTDCHVHPLQTITGQPSASIVTPSHEYPAYLELTLTVADGSGLTGSTSLRLDPATVDVQFATQPSGLTLGVGSHVATAPFTQTVIVGSNVTVAAPTPQVSGGVSYGFSSWSDGGARVHDVTVTAPATFTAAFAPTTPGSGESGVAYLSDLPWAAESNGFGPAERDLTNGGDLALDGTTLSLRGETFLKGVGAHAAGSISVDVPAGCTSFSALVGVDDEVGANGSVTFTVSGDGTSLATTPLLTSASPARPVAVDVSGVDRLTLAVGNGGDDASWDHADWAAARFVCGDPPPPPPSPGAVYVSDLPWSDVTNGFGPPERDTSNGTDAATDGRRMALRGAAHVKGVGAHAAGSLSVDVPVGCTAFSAVVGVDDEVGANGSVTFTVSGDGASLATTPVLTSASPAHPLDVDVTGVDQLTLAVGNGGDDNYWDHADWADARFTCSEPPPGGFTQPQSLPTGDRTHSVVARDLDGDADLDLVAAAAGADAAVVLLREGSGYAPAVSYPTGPGTFPKHVEVGDLTGDGIVDLVTANQDSTSGQDVAVFAGVGDGTFGPAATYPACERPHQTALGDVDGDTDLDVVVACWGGAVVSVLRNDGSGVLGAPEDHTAADAPHSLVLRDFDGDADLDAAVAAFGDNRVAVLLGDGAGGFGAPTLLWSGLGPHNVVSGDLDGDGDADLVLTAQNDDAVGVLLGNGDGTFADAVFHDVGPAPKSSAIGDLDGDGDADLVTANTHGNYPDGSAPTTLTVLLGDGDGGFTPGFTLPNDLTPFSVAAADLDGDGTTDIAAADWHSDDVKVSYRPPP